MKMLNEIPPSSISQFRHQRSIVDLHNTNRRLRESMVVTYNQDTIAKFEGLGADRLSDLDNERLSIANCLGGVEIISSIEAQQT